MDLQDNMQIPSNSWIVINPGSYTIADSGNDGIIQINNKDSIMIYGSGVYVDGTNYLGYMIKITNSSYIQIRNFGAVGHYYYAVHIMNSDHILIDGNDFSYNKVDSSGWISVWTNYQQALGGGVMMYQTNNVSVANNIMRFQNDGVALYECDSIWVTDNSFAWNTSYGVRMYFTDYCTIQNNVASHINRPYTNPSDCAAILLIVSNNNQVTYNDFSYSGDGIFLGQYQYSQIPNNNYFAFNECSYSPHNAIEATFADGNIFENNNCNYSHYGLWLGYSFNSLVVNNEIIGNQYSGIAIDRGFNNIITGNEINENPTGIELWEGDEIPPYQNQFSHDYFILNNTFDGNRIAVSLTETEHSILGENLFQFNRNGIYITGNAADDTVSANSFKNTTLYHIENKAPDDILAMQNDFNINDETVIACKIYDKYDNAAYGEVMWFPYLPGPDPKFQEQYPADMTEPQAVWYAYPETCWGYGLSLPTTIEWDYNEKLFGEAAVHVATGNGWFIGAMYRPAGDSISSWSVLEEDTLTFWLKSINNTGYGFQYCNVIVGNNCGGYYKYTASAAVILNPTIGQWKRIDIPLAGGSPWARSVFGNVSFDDLNYVEINADTWDFGFELWIDGLSFNTLFTDKPEISSSSRPVFAIYPNPADNEITIEINPGNPSSFRFEIFDLHGNLMDTHAVNSPFLENHSVTVNTRQYKNGIYFCRLISPDSAVVKQFIISK
jgi:parallel beta-helix repeat protein